MSAPVRVRDIGLTIATCVALFEAAGIDTERLKSVQQSACYTPPEMQAGSWRLLCNLLAELTVEGKLPKSDVPWVKFMVDVVNGKVLVIRGEP